MKTTEDIEWELMDDAVQSGVMSKQQAQGYDWFGLAKRLIVDTRYEY